MFNKPQGLFVPVNRKTALLIAASAVGCGGWGLEKIHLHPCGVTNGIGMAFQITDDILDMVSEQSQLGKPVGGDLRQGYYPSGDSCFCLQ